MSSVTPHKLRNRHTETGKAGRLQAPEQNQNPSTWKESKVDRHDSATGQRDVKQDSLIWTLKQAWSWLVFVIRSRPFSVEVACFHCLQNLHFRCIIGYKLALGVSESVYQALAKVEWPCFIWHPALEWEAQMQFLKRIMTHCRKPASYKYRLSEKSLSFPPNCSASEKTAI